jgi:hypothetical protein
VTEIPQFLATDLVQRLGWTLLHSLWQGAAVAAAFGVLLLLIPRAKANARYVAGCVSLLAMFLPCIGTFFVVEVPSSPNLTISTPIALPWFEMLCAVALVLGLWVRGAAASIVVMLLAYCQHPEAVPM